jgi:hypothetical protein
MAGAAQLACLLTIAIFLPIPSAIAQTPQRAPITIGVEKRLTVRADGTATLLETQRIKVLATALVEPVSQQHVPFSDGEQKLDIIEAYTEKANGRRVPVDPASIITQGVSGSENMYKPDVKERVIIFPDVQAGDTLVSTTRREMLSRQFPQHFSHLEVFPRSTPYTSVRIVVEAPTELDLQVKTTGTGLTDTVEETGSARRHIMTLTPGQIAAEEPGAVSPIDRDPGFVVSTYKSYQEWGSAWQAIVLPKAAFTPEIAALANEITRGIQDRKAQAIAIDAWMKKNIRYVAIDLSAEGTIPRDAPTVLRHRFGDCKNKAALMAALLEAKGIVSELVVVNAEDTYSLPQPPLWQVFNHAILYLPEFDLYADPTATLSGFGILSPGSYDKPVVRASVRGAKLARTPAMQPQGHVTHVRTIINVAADGSASGRTEQSGTGVFAATLRSLAAQVQAMGVEAAAQQRLQAVNTPGTGRFDLTGTAELREPAIIRTVFNFQGRLTLSPSGTAVIPRGLPLLDPPGRALLGNAVNGRTTAFVCYAGRQREDIEVTFAPGLPMPTPRASRNISNPAFTYRSSYTIEGRTLKIYREFFSLIKGQACPAELASRISNDLNAAGSDIMNNTFNFGGVASAPVATPQRPIETTQTAPTDQRGPQEQQHRIVVTQGTTPQKQRIAFAYVVNQDCSAAELPLVQVVERPINGRVAVEHGTGKVDFPKDNPRSACNGRITNGAVVSYEPDPRFIGLDVVTVKVVFPGGNSMQRRYMIEVRRGGAVSSLPSNPIN